MFNLVAPCRYSSRCRASLAVELTKPTVLRVDHGLSPGRHIPRYPPPPIASQIEEEEERKEGRFKLQGGKRTVYTHKYPIYTHTRHCSLSLHRLFPQLPAPEVVSNMYNDAGLTKKKKEEGKFLITTNRAGK